MAYFDDENNVFDYIKMAEAYDGKELIDVLKRHLKKGSSVLELGMGPGKDFDILNRSYKTTGSDSSQVFLDLYRKNNKSADLLLLDARTLETERSFDCMYSNKVLHHLKKRELQGSLQKQGEILHLEGLIFHSFWKGNKTEVHHGLRFVYYTEDELAEIVGECFELIEIKTYKEMTENDSIYVIASIKLGFGKTPTGEP